MKTLQQTLVVMVATAIMTGAAAAQTLSQQAGPYASWLNAEDLDNGFGVGLKYSLMMQEVAPTLPGLGLGFDIRAGWLTFDGDDNDYGIDMDMFPVELSALVGYEVMKGARPYAGVGGGYYFFDADSSRFDVDDEFGVYVILGWDQKVYEGISVFAEAKYLWLEPEIKGTGRSKADLDVGGFGTNLGVCYNW